MKKSVIKRVLGVIGIALMLCLNVLTASALSTGTVSIYTVGNGSVSWDDMTQDYTYSTGQVITFTIQAYADSGYRLDRWESNLKLINSHVNPLVFKIYPVTGADDYYINAVFVQEKQKYQIYSGKFAEMITPDLAVDKFINKSNYVGESVNIEVDETTFPAGWEFIRWIGIDEDCFGDVESPDTYFVVPADVAGKVIMPVVTQPDAPPYTIFVVERNNDNGVITVPAVPDIYTPYTVEYMTDVTNIPNAPGWPWDYYSMLNTMVLQGHLVEVTAVPSEGYYFGGWSDVDGAYVDNLTDVTINVIPYESGLESMDPKSYLKANFYPISELTYTLTVKNSMHGQTYPEAGEYTYPAGSTVKISTLPADGYEFYKWVSVSISVDKISIPYIDIIMNGNVEIQAEFINSNDGNLMSMTGLWGTIDSGISKSGLGNPIGKLIIAIGLMVAMGIVFRRVKIIAIIGTACLFVLFLVVGWIPFWVVMLLALGAGMFIYYIFARQTGE